MLSKTDAELDAIWFSDETIVKSRTNGETVLYICPPGHEYFVPTNASGGKSVMFWGVVSKAAYGPLVEVKGINNAESYIKTPYDYLLPENRLKMCLKAKGDIIKKLISVVTGNK